MPRDLRKELEQELGHRFDDREWQVFEAGYNFGVASTITELQGVVMVADLSGLERE